MDLSLHAYRIMHQPNASTIHLITYNIYATITYMCICVIDTSVCNHIITYIIHLFLCEDTQMANHIMYKYIAWYHRHSSVYAGIYVDLKQYKQLSTSGS